MSKETIERLVPEVRRPLPRPPPPVLGRRDPSSEDIILVDVPSPAETSSVHSPAETSHVHVLDSPASPDPSPPCSPVDTPSKRPAPSPTVSPSKVRCEGPRYILLQDTQFECPECPLPTSPTLNGDFSLGMLGEVWPSLQTRPRQKDLLRPLRPVLPLSPGRDKEDLLRPLRPVLPHHMKEDLQPLDLRRTPLFQGSQSFYLRDLPSTRFLEELLVVEARLVVEEGIYLKISWPPSLCQGPGPRRLQGGPHRQIFS